MWSGKQLSPAGCQGFTLLEILVAVTILATVVATALGAFNGILGTIGTVRSRGNAYAMGRACMNRIQADLESIHVTTAPLFSLPDSRHRPDPYRLEAASKTLGAESFSWIRFSSLAHVDLDGSGQTGIAQIVYYVTRNDDGTFNLRRQDRLYPWPEFEPDPADPLIAEDLARFDLTFFDDKQEAHHDWDSESSDFDWATPRSIAVTIAIRSGENTINFATRVLLPLRRPPQGKG